MNDCLGSRNDETLSRKAEHGEEGGKAREDSDQATANFAQEGPGDECSAAQVRAPVDVQQASLKRRLKQAATVAGMSESEIVGKALTEERAKNSQRME